MAEHVLPQFLRDDKEGEYFPFSYDHTRRLFLLGSREVADTEPHQLAFAACEEYGARISQDLIKISPVIVDTDVSIITTPVLNNWIQKQDNLAGQVVPVMEEVFCRLAQGKIDEDLLREITDDTRRRMAPGAFGFDARVDEKGWLRLQVYGNCACMGVAFEEGYNCYAENMQLDYPELRLHNIDWEFQYGAIMAGLGHIAILAKE